jgi:hypothetical protein
MPIKKISTIDSWLQDHSPMREADLMWRLSNLKHRALFSTLLTRQQQEQIQTEAKQLERDLQTALQQSEEEPVRAPYADYQKYLWFFKGDVYDVESVMKRHPGYSDEQIQLLILEHFDRERRKFEKLRRLYKSDSIQYGTRRERIPEHIRIAVWRRDGGKCARCGSREKLEYDHIVPVSKGGSNTERNIELLCERCNREKGNRIE